VALLGQLIELFRAKNTLDNQVFHLFSRCLVL
jgi:hypothetical protein